MNKIIEPKACPFCGQVPEAKVIFKEDLEGSGFEFSTVRCLKGNCPTNPKLGQTMGKGESLEAAIKRWNRRAL